MILISYQQIFIFTTTFKVLILCSSIQSINSHAAPDLNDLIQEVIRGHIQDTGVEFVKGIGKAALINTAVDYLKSTFNSAEGNDNDKAQNSKIQNGVDLLDNEAVLQKQSQNIPNKISTFQGPPPTIFQPIVLKESCKNDVSGILNPFEIFDFSSQGRKRKICAPLVICNAYISAKDLPHSDYCALPGSSQSIGVCCTENKILPLIRRESGPVSYITTLSARLTKSISTQFQTILTESTQTAVQLIKSLYVRQEQWVNSGNVDIVEIPVLDPVMPEARDIADGGLGLVETTRALAIKLTGTTNLQKQFPPASVLNTKSGKVFCPASDQALLSCKNEEKNSTTYRTFNGSCNNLQDPTIGQTFQPLIRLTKSAYSDGIFSPRFNSLQSNTSIPSARKVSTTLISGESRPSVDFNLAFAAFGQFIAYDMSHTTSYDLGNSNSNSGSGRSNRIRCCSADDKPIDESLRHPLCYPIEVSEGDDFHSGFGVTCIPFVRSMISSMPCAIGSAQQLNQASHWLDLSPIYGSLDRISNSLREFQGGRLKVLEYRGEDYLILNNDNCNTNMDGNGNCAFRTGDSRANYQLYLTMFHTLWRREHNRVANILQTLHNDYSDEALFLEARRIVIAEYNHIVYNEFVPHLIGFKLAERFHLGPKFHGRTVYDPKIDGSISNEYATAALRIGYTMIPDAMKIISELKDVTSFPIRDSIERPLRLLGNGVQDGVIRGMTRMPMKSVGPSVSKALTDKLFKPVSKFFGMDIVAMTVQRGRDHGLPGYAEVVNSISEYCGHFPIPAIQSFTDMITLIGPQNVEQLKHVYENYQDVDLFIGGVMEMPLAGGLVGPTFGCIIADQFSRSKFGDRFFYEHDINSFTDEQLHEIRISSFARIICDNSGVGEVQPLGLRLISAANPLITCANFFSIPRVDFKFW